MLHLNRFYLKRLLINPYEFAMFVMVAAATLGRFILTYFNWPITNSDEGNMGLLAMHVAYRGELPIFFYGLPYMGPLEGYFAAPLFRLFGVSLFTLRLPLLLLFALFLICMYYLTRLLYTEKFALAIVILLSFGSSIVILLQLRASGEYPETELFAALIFLLASWLALSAHTFNPSAARQVKRKRGMVYACLGLVVGLALWVDFLILPFVAAAGLLLFLFCRRELRTWAGLSLLSGILIGMFPLLFYNVSAPLAQNSLAILYDIHRAGADQAAAQHIPFLRQVIGAVMVSLPLATEVNPYCPLKAFPLFGPPATAALPCVAFQGGWGLGYILLGIIAVYPALRAVRRRKSSAQDCSFEEKQAFVRQCARLMLLVAAAITLVSYMLSPVAAIIPDIVWRYLICMLIALPAVLWPLWNGNTLLMTAPLKRAKVLLILKMGVLLLVAGTFFLGSIRTFVEGVPEAQAAYAQEDTLVHDLLRIGATRIYSEYWTCNRLIFHSREQIICGALDDQLKPGFDRYTPYRLMLRASLHPVYVFPLNSPQTMTFQREMLSPDIPYRHYVFDGYDVYQSG
jgi:4-amino-4-deoxy-L-arabinose transferase-like glycosyltransferase